MKLPGNMQQMMRQAQQMQEKMQQEIALIKVEATAGGGMVTVGMDGQKNLLSVKIDPEVAGDVEMLQDMIVAAANEAVKKVDAEIQQKMGGMLGGMGLPPGLLYELMPDFAEPLARLITEFKRLPGIGQKSAQRLAFHVLRASRDDAAHLAQAFLDVKDKLGLCSVCNNVSESELCLYCSDPNRDGKIVCVVEEPHNIVGIETTREFEGRYHVLQGALSPLRGIGPESLDQRPGGTDRPGRDRGSDRRHQPHRGG